MAIHYGSGAVLVIGGSMRPDTAQLIARALAQHHTVIIAPPCEYKLSPAVHDFEYKLEPAVDKPKHLPPWKGQQYKRGFK